MYAVGSLFSGIGGIELGLEQASDEFETVWFVEKEEFAQDVLRAHWPETPIYADVTKVDFNDLPEVDVLTGGFPCQDISLAGKGAGIEGSRSGLWAYCVEAIGALRPRVALFENVAAITGRGLDRVLADLAALGYDAEWHCFSASSVGALHRRDRIAIIAYPATDGDEGQRGRAQEQVSAGRDSAYGSIQGVDGQRFTPDAGGARARGVSEDVQARKPESCLDSADVPDVQGERAGSVHVRQGRSRQQAPYSDGRGKKVPDTDEEGLQRRQDTGETSRGRENAFELFAGQGQSYQRDYWAAEPLLGRVANGIPDRVDRIKALGNAVVPPWAEAVGRAIIRSGVLE